MQTFKRIHLFVLLLLIASATTTQAQQNQTHVHGRNCAAHDVLQQQIQQDPARQQQLRQIENATQQYIRTHGNSRNNQTRIIPVYVHVLYRTAQENISTAQIQSQIDVMNRDFAASNTDISGVPSIFQSVTAGNSGIQFELTNVTRKQTSKSSWGTNDAMKLPSQGGVAPLTPSTHLNLWVCNIGGGILGYAQFPGGASSTDGVVISPQYVGDRNSPGGNNFYLASPFDGGRTAVHEVGHYLNLRHIWGDGGCAADDFVDDTPIAGQSNNGCPSAGTNTCSGGLSDMFMNYMDYVDDACMFMFSEGQVARMWATLNTTRSTLGYTPSTGGGTNPPTACNDNEVVLTLNFDNYASETSWSIVDANGTTLHTGSGYTNGTTNYTETFCLPNGCYDFVINDSYGDGICCSYGNGSYSLDLNGTNLVNGSSFTSSETKQLCLTAPPTCNDGIMNGDETGVDCGGSNCPTCPTCNDGIMNGDETGVDCGGSNCAACPTCSDGVMNGDETGVDCGGSNCPTCPTNGGSCSDNEVVLTLAFDNYASETSWSIVDANGNALYTGNGYSNGTTAYTETFCLPAGCYDFVINDSYGDGICCSYGNGSYSLDLNGTNLVNGSAFTSSETKQFCLTGTPTCTDVTLDLDFDNYASETSWSIVDASGTTLHTGNGYANGTAAYTETFCLPAGCYDFVINDSYGDGICCSYGNGSYNINTNGVSLVNGGSFGASETKTFCVGGATSRLIFNNTTNEIGAFQPIMNVYPNPATSYIFIELLNIQETSIGTIQDATGRQLWQGGLDEGENRINIQNLPAGLYYFRAVQHNGKVITKKFIRKG